MTRDFYLVLGALVRLIWSAGGFRRCGDKILPFRMGLQANNSLEAIFRPLNNGFMKWEVEYCDEFGDWQAGLTDAEHEAIRASVKLLGDFGPRLQFPHSSGINGARHTNRRELRIQYAGRPYRVLFAFDPRRCAILLFGGDKTGNDRWYEEYVPITDRLYGEHLDTLRKEGLIDG